MRSLRAAEDFRRANWRTVAGILALTVVLSTAMDLFLTAENWTGFWSATSVYLLTYVMAYTALVRQGLAQVKPREPAVGGALGVQFRGPEGRVLIVAVVLLAPTLALAGVGMIAFELIKGLVGLGPSSPPAIQMEMDWRVAIGLTAGIAATLGGLVFLLVRSSLAIVATVARGRISFGWSLVKGAFWKVLLAVLVVTGIPALADIVIDDVTEQAFGVAGAGGTQRLPLAIELPLSAATALLMEFVFLPLSVGLSVDLYRTLQSGPEAQAEVFS